MPMKKTNTPTMLLLASIQSRHEDSYSHPIDTPMMTPLLLLAVDTLVNPSATFAFPFESVPPVPKLPLPDPKPDRLPITDVVDIVSGAAETNATVKRVEGVIVESRAWKTEVDGGDSVVVCRDDATLRVEVVGREETANGDVKDWDDVLNRGEAAGDAWVTATEGEMLVEGRVFNDVVTVGRPAATEIGPAPTFKRVPVGLIAADIEPAPTPSSVPVGSTATDIGPAPTPSRVPVGLMAAEMDPAATLKRVPVGSTATDNCPAPTARSVPVGSIAAVIDGAWTPRSVPVGSMTAVIDGAWTSRSVPVGSMAAVIDGASTPSSVPVGSMAAVIEPAPTPRSAPVVATPTDKRGSEVGPIPAPIRGPELGATPSVRSPIPNPKSAPSGAEVVWGTVEVVEAVDASSPLPNSPPSNPLSGEAVGVEAGVSDVGTTDVGSAPPPNSPPNSPVSGVAAGFDAGISDVAAGATVDVGRLPPPRSPSSKAARGEFPSFRPCKPSSPIMSLHKFTFISKNWREPARKKRNIQMLWIRTKPLINEDEKRIKMRRESTRRMSCHKYHDRHSLALRNLVL